MQGRSRHVPLYQLENLPIAQKMRPPDDTTRRRSDVTTAVSTARLSRSEGDGFGLLRSCCGSARGSLPDEALGVPGFLQAGGRISFQGPSLAVLTKNFPAGQ